MLVRMCRLKVSDAIIFVSYAGEKLLILAISSVTALNSSVCGCFECGDWRFGCYNLGP